MGANDGRRANELKIILRLAFLYGCFHRDDISNILNVNKETLNKEYGILVTIFEKEYCIPDKRKEEVLLDYNRSWKRFNNLWNVYVKEQLKPSSYKRIVQYIGIMNQINRHQANFRELFFGWNTGLNMEKIIENVDDRLLGISKKEIQNIIKRTTEQISDKSIRNICNELVDLGVIYKNRQKYHLVYPPFQKLTTKEYDQISHFMRYAVNLIFPALPGYNLLKIIENNKQDNKHDEGDIFVFIDYQAQSLLDEENYLELASFRQEMRPVKFIFRDNCENVLEVQSPAEKQERNVMPYCFLHEIRYGRTYLVGYCAENGQMMGYELERISNITVSHMRMEEDTADLEQMYQDTFAKSWIGGRVDKKSPERKRVRLEIMQDSKKLERIKAEGMTDDRKGQIFEEAGKLFYEIVLPNTKDIKPWIMSLGADVRVISVTGVTTGCDYSEDENELKWDIKHTWEEMKRIYEENGKVSAVSE